MLGNLKVKVHGMGRLLYNGRWNTNYVSMLQRWVIKKSKYERSQELCGEFQIKETMSIEVSEAR